MWVAAMLRSPRSADEAFYRDYLARRLVAALERAARARTARELSVHLRACRYYCDLLTAP